MKRVIPAFSLALLFLACCPGITALATDDAMVNEPSNMTITVVMPTPEATPEPQSESTTPTPVYVYPTDVSEIHEGNQWQIIKTYELEDGESPEDIPRDSFERNGWVFTLTDILRKETAQAETREHTEIVTLSTSTKSVEQILSQLAPTMEYQTEDGFFGVLILDVSSIKVETAGTKTSAYTTKVTREYPHLSTNDTSLVPKTVEEKGTVYTLADVEWKAGNLVTVDYEQFPEYYTAVATYTATGYTTTAIYIGTLTRLMQGKTAYVAYFIGTEIRTPLELRNCP